MRRFLEEEAELGSDNEDNDDVRKKINRDADDEEDDEEGLDDDLVDFVVHEGDDVEIGEENEQMADDFRRRQMDLDDREMFNRTVNAVIFGHNKKRKRDEVEGLDVDDNGRRKMRMIEERMREL
jgi:hypothetical protein